VGEVKSNTEWIAWGNRDPLYGTVAFEGREREGAQPWSDEDFYALGQSDWMDFLEHWNAYGLDCSRCVEIGCGPGRMTKQICTTFAHVDALDVSPGMLAYAAAHVDADNVVFHATDGATIPVPDGSTTAAFSSLVFQHLDGPDEAAAYFREIYRVLAGGGSMMIHLTMHDFPFPNTRLARLFRASYRAKTRMGDVRARYRRARLRAGADTAMMRGQSFEVYSLKATLARIGFHRIEFWNFAARSNGGYYPCVLAQK
jgi:ubiquinone/menaquinone biosynthesis C-methylase UbiE